MIVRNFQDETRAVTEAAAALGRHVPQPHEMSVSQWRQVALATLGHAPSANPSRAEVLQVAGMASHCQFETEERSRNGPLVSRFYGDPRSTWAPFMGPAKLMRQINNHPENAQRPRALRNLNGQVVRIETAEGSVL